MTDPEEFIENFLSHALNPQQVKEYNRQYYLRNRKLKGRTPGGVVPAPGSNQAYNGDPLPRGNKRMNEDETPKTSPGGNGKLVDYDGKGNGKATYADGWVYEPATGWKKGGQAAVVTARATNNAQRAKSGLAPKDLKGNVKAKRRIGAAEQKIIRARTLAKRVKDPADRELLMKRLRATERKLKSVKARMDAGSTDTSKRPSSTRPVLRRQPPRGV